MGEDRSQKSEVKSQNEPEGDCRLQNAECRMQNEESGTVSAESAKSADDDRRLQNTENVRGRKAESRGRKAGLGPAFCLALLLAGSPARGGEYENPALVTGIEALGVNPAQLADASRPRHSYQLLALDAGLSNNSLRGTQYNRYTGAFLDESAKQDILGSIPRSGLRLDGNVRLDATALTVGPFGFAVRGRAGMSGNVPKDVVDLVLRGNELDRTYSAATLGGEAIAYTDATISFGIPITPALRTGFGLKYLRGLFIAQSTDVDGYLLTTPYVINSQVLTGYRWATGGNGFGLDWGMSYDFEIAQGRLPNLGRHVRVALAVTNLNLGIDWNRNPGAAVFRLNLDSVNLWQVMKQRNVARTEFTQTSPGSFKTVLPIFLNLGATWVPARGLNVGLSVLEGFRNTALSSAIPAATLGAECRGLSWLPMSAAMTVGGRHGLVFGCGLGCVKNGFSILGRIANTGGLGLSARGMSAGISLGYQVPGSGSGDPESVRLYYDPSEGNGEE